MNNLLHFLVYIRVSQGESTLSESPLHRTKSSCYLVSTGSLNVKKKKLMVTGNDKRKKHAYIPSVERRCRRSLNAIPINVPIGRETRVRNP